MLGSLPIGSTVWIQDSASGAYVELELQASLDDSVYLRVTGRQSKSLPESANYISSICYNFNVDKIQTKGGYEKSETASFLTSEYIRNAICNFRS
jgi:hypothetical protein